MAEAGLPAPEYRQNEFMVYATIRLAKEAAGKVAGNGDLNGDVNGLVSSLKGSLKEVYMIVLNNPGIKIGQVAEARGKSESTVWKQLTSLRKMGLIEYRGSDKTGGYYAK
jgi:ATP-dependent DNA helicase RecG